MNVFDPWNLVFTAGFLVYLSTRHVFLNRTRDVKRTDRGAGVLEIPLLIGVVVTGFLLPLLYLFSPLLSFADTVVPVVVSWTGLCILLLSLWMFWRSHADLGTQLVRDGRASRRA